MVYLFIFALRLILDILDMYVVLTHPDFLVGMLGIIILMIIPTGSYSPSVHVINYASNISSDGVVGLDYNTIDSDSCGLSVPLRQQLILRLCVSCNRWW